MLVRSWIAFLLLANYLLIAGMGCIMQPYEQQTLLMVQTTYEGQHYQECRYLRMDGLEDFLIESMESRYQNAPQLPPHHSMSVVNAVDTHCLPDELHFSFTPDFRELTLADTPKVTGLLSSIFLLHLTKYYME
ncbi:hypothetical protein, partial [Runella sp.]|uniref:hypothetical protein n=1 Tax=Runella sp. TaxID=1960881 RepID=UPI0030187609